MNTDNQNYQITRREALCSLATLPMITLGLSSPKTILQKAQYKSALEQCAASVEACWELRLSNNANDRLLSFQCATKYLPTLKAIAQNSSQDRLEALNLATRYTITKTFLAWHCTGFADAIQCGKDAVVLSKEAGDISLQIIALQSLAWTYCRAKKDKLALLTAQEAETLLQNNVRFPNAQLLHPYVWGRTYSTLAMAQARNGLSPEASLGKVEISPDEGKADVIDFDHTTLLLEAGEAYCYYGDQGKAMAWLKQRVDPETLLPTIVQSGIGRIETINFMALSSLKTKDRDIEKAIHFWTAGIEGAKTLKSEQRFNEALMNYDLIEAIWSGEPRIADLRDHIVHWKE